MFTVVILAGPTMSGKSYFAKTRLVPELERVLKEKGINPNIKLISSDELRRYVISNPIAHKYSLEMMQASEKAFKLLHQQIDIAMEWPHNAHFIIVDTTGLSEEFRNQVVAQAKVSQYNVAIIVFDYKKKEEYEKFVPSDEIDRRILYKHLDRLRTEVWRTLKRDIYDGIFTLRTKDFSSVEINISDVETYTRTILNNNLTYDIVSDIHGCYNELIELLKLAKYIINDNKITPPNNHGLVVLGDTIDKGPDTLKILQLLHSIRNEPWFHLVWGNHENFVTKHLNNELDETATHGPHLDYFDSVDLLKDNVEAKQMLLDLRQVATNCVQNIHFIATHAPCENKFLGKLDSFSTKTMRGQYQRPKRDNQSKDDYIKSQEKFFSFIKDQSIFNAPLHIFGHVSLANTLRVKNQIGIDTGCVVGGRLTMVSVGERRPYYVSLPSQQPVTEELIELWRTREDEIDFGALDGKEFRRIMHTARDKISFISGTMAPAEADEKNNILESLDKALAYYRHHGVEAVVLQPKYMGSRCNVYLSQNLDECFATSRNGFIIKPKQVDLKPMFKELIEQFKNYFVENKAKTLILDGELMPWRVLGAGLIDEQFGLVEYALQSELDALQTFGFEDVLTKINSDIENVGFKSLQGTKGEISKQLGQAKARTYRTMITRPIQSLKVQQELLNTYREQVKIFGVDELPSFKPFGILKIIYQDDSEKNCQEDGNSNYEQFISVSKDNCLLLNLKEDWKPAHDFFEKIASSNMEGVVVKPEIIKGGIAPALKVRNPRYLTIVYGYDYTLPSKYERLIRTKFTRKKVESSITEFALGQKMLSILQSEIGENNKRYLQLIASMISEEKVEKGLDPRL